MPVHRRRQVIRGWRIFRKGGAMTATYLRNNWYQAAWASELSDAPLARTLLDEPIVFFRTGAGIAALQDRCPHRFAPLSAGRFQGGTVRCGYHGLTFDGSGRCVHNPYGPITEPMKVRSYPGHLAAPSGAFFLTRRI